MDTNFEIDYQVKKDELIKEIFFFKNYGCKQNNKSGELTPYINKEKECEE